ncbi:MAG: hypothetical protein ACI9U1_000849 [Porticoccaceae bacterium]
MLAVLNKSLVGKLTCVNLFREQLSKIIIPSHQSKIFSEDILMINQLKRHLLDQLKTKLISESVSVTEPMPKAVSLKGKQIELEITLPVNTRVSIR